MPHPRSFNRSIQQAMGWIGAFGESCSLMDHSSSEAFKDRITSTFRRFDEADGFAHARALAFQMAMTALPLFIAGVGFVVVLSQGSARTVLKEAIFSLTPGPTSRTLSQAFRQGSQAASGSQLALWAGLLAGLTSATTAMVYVERAMNRIYGIREDRARLQRYVRGAFLACSAGLLILLSFVLFVAGSAMHEIGWSGAPKTVWSVARWPILVALLGTGLLLVLRFTPNREQPSPRHLAGGVVVGGLLWIAGTGALAGYLTLSRTIGRTYGTLAGVIGLLLWSFLSAVALYLGAAYAAETDPSRAGAAKQGHGEAA